MRVDSESASAARRKNGSLKTALIYGVVSSGAALLASLALQRSPTPSRLEAQPYAFAFGRILGRFRPKPKGFGCGLTIDILDTEFVIALERERKTKRDGPAKCFLGQHASDRFFITFTVAGELACGRSADAKQAWQRLCRPFFIIPWNPEISWI